jgi:hypothetical protein
VPRRRSTRVRMGLGLLSKRVVSTGSDRVRMPPDGCRGPAALANNAGSLRDGPHLAVELVPTLPGSTNVVDVGRAVTVPVTAVTTGPQRTRTDNAAVAVTCDVRHPTRSQSSLIWLCKQVVDWLPAWIGLPCPAGRCGPWSREGIGNAVRRPRPDGTADPEQESANLSCAMIPMLD